MLKKTYRIYFFASFTHGEHAFWRTIDTNRFQEQRNSCVQL